MVCCCVVLVGGSDSDEEVDAEAIDSSSGTEKSGEYDMCASTSHNTHMDTRTHSCTHAHAHTPIHPSKQSDTIHPPPIMQYTYDNLV